MNTRTLLAAALTFTTAGALAAPPPGILGKWREPSGSVIDIHPCGPNICLTLIEVAHSPVANDAHNPDPALRTRPLCGLEIGTGFQLHDANHAEGGRLYDPKSGKTYSGALTSSDDTLHLRGYIGAKIFGRSQDWTRAPFDTQSCRP